MKNVRRNPLLLVLTLIQSALLFNCGQNSASSLQTTTSSDISAVSISISPQKNVIGTGQTLQFSAAVTGSSQKGVTWSVSGSGSIGSISSSGLYTAPTGPLGTTVTVKAASVANPSKYSLATVWIVAPGVVSTSNNPMVANYALTTPSSANVEIQFGPDTSYGLNTWSQPSPSGGGETDVLVAGMRASTTYHMRAVVDFPDGSEYQDIDHTFTPQGPDASLIPQITVTVPSGQTPSGGVEMLGLNVFAPPDTQLEAVVTDLSGNLIWYYNFPEQWTTAAFPFPMKLLSNGHILINCTPAGGGNGGPGVLREIDLAGNTIRQMTTADLNARLANADIGFSVFSMHHDFVPLPNGHLIILGAHTKQFTDLPGYPGTTTVVGDAIIDLDENWNPVWIWDTFDHLDVNRHPENFPDWTHSNALVYSPDDGNLLLSMRHQNWIIKIDYEDGKGSGDILWRLGYQGDFTLTGSTSPADWFNAQHGPKILSPASAGAFTLGIFDNGNYRVMDNSGDLCGIAGQPACYSRVPIFTVDEATKTAQVIWQDTLPLLSIFGGNMQEFNNNNVEFDIAGESMNPFSARIQEVTQDPTPQLVWQMDITGQAAYRAFRIPSLYPGVQW